MASVVAVVFGMMDEQADALVVACVPGTLAVGMTQSWPCIAFPLSSPCRPLSILSAAHSFALVCSGSSSGGTGRGGGEYSQCAWCSCGGGGWRGNCWWCRSPNHGLFNSRSLKINVIGKSNDGRAAPHGSVAC